MRMSACQSPQVSGRATKNLNCRTEPTNGGTITYGRRAARQQEPGLGSPIRHRQQPAFPMRGGHLAEFAGLAIARHLRNLCRLLAGLLQLFTRASGRAAALCSIDAIK